MPADQVEQLFEHRLKFSDGAQGADPVLQLIPVLGVQAAVRARAGVSQLNVDQVLDGAVHVRRFIKVSRLALARQSAEMVCASWLSLG